MLPLFEDCGLKHRLGYNSANELNFTQHEKAFAVRPTNGGCGGLAFDRSSARRRALGGLLVALGMSKKVLAPPPPPRYLLQFPR